MAPAPPPDPPLPDQAAPPHADAQSPALSLAASARSIEIAPAGIPRSACRAPPATPLAHPCATPRLRRGAPALPNLGWFVHSCDKSESNARPLVSQSRSAPILQSNS